jgi:hypothetical protein
MALGQSRPVAVQNQGYVGIPGHRLVQEAEKKNLPRRAGQDIRPAHHQIDLLVHIVRGYRQLV